ncbi:MAG: P1 family peptidase [Alphaproteobacteria bacterium]
MTDVRGIKVGSAEDHGMRSGVTVILPDAPVVCAVDVRGGAPGTRETDLADPTCLVDRVDAVVLAGGSAFGLDAASGVVDWLKAKGRGFRVDSAVVPIVPAAILFDLLNGGDKDWGHRTPYRALGAEACSDAAERFRLGNAGAGLGATVGHPAGTQIKGGLGSASFVIHCTSARPPITVAALAAVNPVGSVLLPGSGVFWAWPFEQAGEFGARRLEPGFVSPGIDDHFPGEVGGNTTLVVIATDAALSKAEAKRVAIMAQDGIARAIRPAHTPFDGDTVFVLATGAYPLDGPASLARVGMLAADATTRAIARGVYEADDLDHIRSYRSLHPDR